MTVFVTSSSSSSSASETICSAPFTDKIRTAVHYIVSKNQKLTIKSSVKKVCFQPALETAETPTTTTIKFASYNLQLQVTTCNKQLATDPHHKFTTAIKVASCKGMREQNTKKCLDKITIGN